MRLLVTKALTKNGRYYKAGTIVDVPDEQGSSWRGLYGWAYADEDGQETVAPVYDQALAPGPVLADLTKKQLRAYAADNDVKLPVKATKTEILEILEA